MKRSVMAAVISAMLLAAMAAPVASCTWMGDLLETETKKSDVPDIPLDEVLTVDELLAGSFAGDTVWVRGWIIGGLASDGAVDFGCEGTVLGTALVLAEDAGCTEEDDCLVLQLTKKAHKEALALDNPANKEKVLYRELFVQGKVGKHKGYPALSNLCAYKLE